VPADLLLFDPEHITAHDQNKSKQIPLDCKFPLVLNVLFFLPGDSLASEFYVPTFRNTLPNIFFLLTPPMKMENTEYFETSAHKIQTPRNYQKERIQEIHS
jgi:hypothetical protein